MKQIAGHPDSTTRLYDIEIRALRMLNGELPDAAGGAWFNTCCERLRSMGYISMMPYGLTEKGKQFLEQLDASSSS